MLNISPELSFMLDKAWEFIKTNRTEGKKCFWGWSEEEVKNTLLNAICNKAFMMCSDYEGNVIGIVHGRANDDMKLFHVGNILTSHPNAMKVFITNFDHLWPNYSLAGQRYGNIVNYNTPRFKSIMKGRKYV